MTNVTLEETVDADSLVILTKTGLGLSFHLAHHSFPTSRRPRLCSNGRRSLSMKRTVLGWKDCWQSLLAPKWSSCGRSRAQTTGELDLVNEMGKESHQQQNTKVTVNS